MFKMSSTLKFQDNIILLFVLYKIINSKQYTFELINRIILFFVIPCAKYNPKK